MKRVAYKTPPMLRTTETPAGMMGDVLLTMMPIYVMAAYYYGFRVPLAGLLSGVLTWGLDLLCARFAGKKNGLQDYSGMVTGLMIPLLLPASASFGIILAADVFAVIVVKYPFGGFGNNLFNPAAGGLLFATICFPTQVFQYPSTFSRLPVWGTVSVKAVEGTTAALKLGGQPSVELFEMLLGNFAGPAGATCVLVLVMCVVYLMVRRTIGLEITLSFLAASALIALLFPRIASGGRLESVWFELFSGTLLFGAVFVMSDPVTAPRLPAARIVYGALGGVTLMLFRYFGPYELGLCFAVLIANTFSHILDEYMLDFHMPAFLKRFSRQETDGLSADSDEEEVLMA